MTRFIHDQFSKDYLEMLLSAYGSPTAGQSIRSEIKEIDVFFSPSPPQLSLSLLGLLGQFCVTPCLFEPYRNPVTEDEGLDCVSKLLAVREDLIREAKRNKKKLAEEEKPRLWILTPTASDRLLGCFSARLSSEWSQGIYFLPEAFRTALVVIHRLPETPETLWLRLLGRGGTKARAIDEVEALPLDHPFRTSCLELLYNLSKDLELTNNPIREDRRLIMRLTPFFQIERQQAVEEGLQQGIERGLQQGVELGRQQEAVNLVLRSLNRKLGETSVNLREQIEQLSVEELENLLDALFDFEEVSDLESWLN